MEPPLYLSKPGVAGSHMAMPSFELGAEALNSGPRAYIASVLCLQAISPAQEDWVLQIQWA